MTWHRPARILVGVLALASAAAAYVSSTRRSPAAPPPVERMDPKAILESRAAVLQQVRENEEQFELKAERTLHYEDGSTRQYGIRLSVRNRSGRDYIVTAKEARAGKEAKDLELAGDVRLAASDGFALDAQSATYNQDQGLVRAPGEVTFTKGRLKGSATGMSYDTNTEVLSLLAKPDVRFEPAEIRQGAGDAVPGGVGVAGPDSAPAVAQGTGHGGSRQPGDGGGRRGGAAVRGRAARQPGRAARTLVRQGRRLAREHDCPRHGPAVRRGRRDAAARGADRATRRWWWRRGRGAAAAGSVAASWTSRSTRRARWSARPDATAWW